MAKEDAVDPNPTQPQKTEGVLGEQQVQMFNILRDMLSKSTVHTAMVQEGASPEQPKAMEDMWEAVGQVVEHSKAPPAAPMSANPGPKVLPTPASASGGEPPKAQNASETKAAVSVPVGEDDEVMGVPEPQEDEVEAAWANHMDQYHVKC